MLTPVCAHCINRRAKKTRILGAAEFSKHFKPKKIPRGVSSNGKYAFYLEDNKEIGGCFGTIVDSALRKWLVDFHDGVKEHMSPKQMALSLQVC